MNPAMQNSEFRMQNRPRHASIRSMWRVVFMICILHSAFSIGSVSAQQQPGMPGSMGFTGGVVASNVPPKIEHVTFSQRLGEQLPLDARLTDETGRQVELGEYFKKDKPVVLAFVYFQCPMLCPMTMEGTVTTLSQLKFDIGRDFDVITVSIRS